MSSSTAVSQATETNTTALMSSDSYSWDCGDDCDTTSSFCFQDECFSIDGCEGECDEVEDCDTCFCGFCFDDDDDYVSSVNVTNTSRSLTSDSSKKLDTFLPWLGFAAVFLIGIIGLLVLRFFNNSRYRKLKSSVEKRAASVETTDMEVETRRKKSDVYF